MLTKKAHKHLKGCAEVEAVVDTQMGNSETYIKKDSKGYIKQLQEYIDS